MNDLTFLEQFAAQYAWEQAPAKRCFRYKKSINHGLQEEHRLALTLGGVIDRALDDSEGLQSSDYSTYQIFEADDLVFKLIDLENIKTSRVGFVPRRGIMSPAYIRLAPISKATYSRYYYWLFYGAYANHIFNGMGGGVRQNLTPFDLLEFPLPLPPLGTQRRIARFLDEKTARIDSLLEKKRALLSRLAEKRQALITHAVTNGLNPAASMKPSGVDRIGDIPAHWKVLPTKRVTRFGYGDTLVGDDRLSGQVKVYGSNGPFDEHSSANTLAPCIIIGRKGSYGKLNYSEVPVFAVDTTFVVDRRHTNADIRFLYYVLSILGLDELSDDIAVPGLSREKAYQSPCPLPPLDTQRQIARFLDEKTGAIDRQRALIEKSCALLEEYRAALITAAVTGRIEALCRYA